MDDIVYIEAPYQDINGVEIEEGDTITYSAEEMVIPGLVKLNRKYHGLFVNSVPLQLIMNHKLTYKNVIIIKKRK